MLKRTFVQKNDVLHIYQAAKFLPLGKPLGGGGSRAIKEKVFFFQFFCNLKTKDILLKTTYHNINTGNVGKVAVFSHVCFKIWLF